MAFHCGAPTRDGSPCQRHVRELGIRCAQHRKLGGTALHLPRHAMRTVDIADPALTMARSAWTSARADRTAHAGELRDRVTPTPEQESPDTPAGTHRAEDDGARATDPATEPGSIGTRSYLDRERSRRVRAEADGEREAAGEGAAEHAHANAWGGSAREAAGEGAAERVQAERERRGAEPQPEAERPSALLSYLDRERARRLKAKAEAEPYADADAAEPASALSYIARQRAANSEFESDEPDQPSEAEPEREPEPRPIEQRPQLRKERALDPDWIAARPLFRDEAPTRPLPKIEFEPSEGRAPRRPPRVPPVMRSVVLNPPANAPQAPVTPNGFAAEPDPPTLIDRMPPIDHDDLVVPDFLRPDFGAPAAAPGPRESRPPLPQRTPRPWPIPKGSRKPKAEPDHPTLIDQHPPIPAEDAAAPVARAAATAKPAATTTPTAGTRAATTAPTAPDKPATPATPAAATAAAARVTPPAPATATGLARPAAAAATTAPATPSGRTAAAAPAASAADPAAPDDIAVPDFIVPGFTQPAKPPLRTVLSTVLGPDLWQRCYVEWSAGHCTALARIARTVDGLAPSAGTAVRSTAGAGMRWLGVAREREVLADEVAAAISHRWGRPLRTRPAPCASTARRSAWR